MIRAGLRPAGAAHRRRRRPRREMPLDHEARGRAPNERDPLLVATAQSSFAGLTTYMLIEPRLGHLPIAHNRVRRDFQDLRGLFDAESSEITQLDHSALPPVNARKLVESVVE